MAITTVRQTDRTMKCASCPSTATVLVLKDGQPWSSACERHKTLQHQRAIDGAQPSCTIPCDGTGWTGNPRERCTTHYQL